MASSDEDHDRVIRRIAEQLGVTEEKLRPHLAEGGFQELFQTIGVDSLDVVELIMELEDDLPDEFGPDNLAPKS